MQYKLALLALTLTAAHAQHAHLNAGAVAQTQGAQMTWDNAAEHNVASAWVRVLSFATTGRYAGRYEGNITLTAMHSVDAFGAPVPGGPAPGSMIWAEIVSVAGPEGGAFSFWESTGAEPAFTAPTGSTGLNFSFVLSEESLGAGQPGGDPYGHIHGRRFTANKPGLYRVGFRAIDRNNIHTPSEIVELHFQADYLVSPEITFSNGMPIIRFAAPSGFVVTVEAKGDLNPETPWQSVAQVGGTDHFMSVMDELANGAPRFYRLSLAPAAP